MKRKALVQHYIYIIFVVILIALGCFIILNKTLSAFFGRKIDQRIIIKKFESNYSQFNDVLEELSDIDEISFNNDNGYIYINIYNYDEDGTLIKTTIKRTDLEFNKYKKTTKLIKELNLLGVTKGYQNISFQFNSTIGISQNIVYMNNSEEYNLNHQIITAKKIKNKWNYIELK